MLLKSPHACFLWDSYLNCLNTQGIVLNIKHSKNEKLDYKEYRKTWILLV